MADVSFSVMLSSANEAFSTEPEAELARILRELADRIQKPHDGTITLRDSNGNRVGVATLDIQPTEGGDDV